MGVGNSLEASYALRAAIPAGVWRLSADGIIAGATAQVITVRFEVRLRAAGADGGAADVVVVSFQNRFVRSLENRFAAVRFSASAPAPEVRARAGDLLVLHATALEGDPGASYIFNGEGANSGGEIPRLDLPQAS